MLAKKDGLTMKINAYRSFLNTASAVVDRYSKTEIKICSAVDVKILQKLANKMYKEYRELDAKLHGLNWTTDLL